MDPEAEGLEPGVNLLTAAQEFAVPIGWALLVMLEAASELTQGKWAVAWSL